MSNVRALSLGFGRLNAMRTQMKAAYALISDYKGGAIPVGSPISEEQEHLIRMLGHDLQVDSEGVPIQQLVKLVARADSLWNKRTMAAVDRFYALREAGELAKAETERNAFIGECPSVWYCGILSAL